MSGHSVSLGHFAPAGSFRAAMGRTWTMLGAMMRARRTRRLLGEMDDRLLADIGIGRGDALMEASRPWWDVAPRRR